MTHPQPLFVGLAELEQEAEQFSAMVAKLHPVQRNTFFRMVAETLRQNEDSLTLSVIFDRLQRDYEVTLYRDESH